MSVAAKRAMIKAFFGKPHFVVVGASTNRDKFGNKVGWWPLFVRSFVR